VTQIYQFLHSVNWFTYLRHYRVSYTRRQ